MRDDTISKVKTSNLKSFRDKYLGDKLAHVQTQRLEKISRSQFDNVEMDMRALPKRSKQKLEDTFRQLTTSNEILAYEDAFQEYMIKLAPRMRQNQIVQNKDVIDRAIKDMFKGDEGEVPPSLS